MKKDVSPCMLVSREFKEENTCIKVGDAVFGDNSMPVIAGPCAVESQDQVSCIARSVKQAGAKVFRGGVFKPRTSPYAFQGLGEKGLHFLCRVREKTGLPVITEVLDLTTFDSVEACTDIIQIGTRNMQNFSLLKRAGKSSKPILLKRGMSATLSEWLMAAEYIMEQGNSQIVLCERGIRTFATHSRNTLDLSIIPAVKKLSHLPIIVDPSHATGVRDQVYSMACACAAADADGILIEVHNEPEHARCDGAQSLYPDQFTRLMEKLNAIHEIVKRD